MININVEDYEKNVNDEDDDDDDNDDNNNNYGDYCVYSIKYTHTEIWIFDAFHNFWK